MKNIYLLFFCTLFTGTSLFAQHNSDNATIDYVKNKGQWNQNVLYKAKIGGGEAWLENDQITFSFLNQEDVEKAHEARHSKTAVAPVTIKGYVYKMKFVGSNSNHGSVGKETSSTVHNYFLGSDQSKWAGNVPLYGKVNYIDLFAGINADLYSSEGHFKYDYIIAPNADAGLVKWKYEGVEPSLKDGNIIVTTPVGDVVEQKPYAYQIINGSKKKVDCKYVLNEGIYSFVFPEGYDKNFELVIDPTLVFSTYTGSSADNWGFTATYDDNGAMYVGGIVFGSGYPTTAGAFDLSFTTGNTDAAISKFNPTGTTMVYSTYLGGNSADSPHSLIVDASGNLIVMGTTGSSNFPVTAGCYDNSFNGGPNIAINSNSYTYGSGSDIFVTKFNANGSALIGSTFVGGTGNDGLNLNGTLTHNYSDEIRGEVVLGSNGEIYVASSTLSTNFPTTAGALATTAPAGQNGCAFKLNANLTSLIWSTYIGGGDADAGYALKASPNGNVYVTGGTLSNNFPITAGTIKTTYGGNADGFVISLSDANGAMVASTYLGTTSYDQSYLIELDNNDNIYVAGQTKGAYPITAGVYNNNGSSQFIHKMNPALTSTVFSTVFGKGTHNVTDISLTAFLVDNCQNIYVSGWGGTTNNEGSTSGLPVTANAYDNSTDGSDFYFIVLERNAQALLYATFFGGSPAEHVDGGTSRFDKNGTIYQAVCAGCGGSNNFPTTSGVWSTTNQSSNCNLGAIKMAFDYNGIDANPTASPNVFACNPPFNVNFQGSADAVTHVWDFGDGTPNGNTQNPVHTYTTTGNFNVMYIAIDPATCNIADTVYLSVQAINSEVFSANFNIPPYDPCNAANYAIDLEFTGSGSDSLHWDMGNGTTFTNDTAIHFVYSTPGTYIVSLTAWDFSCSQSLTFTDTVNFGNSNVSAVANAAPNVLACDPPYDVTFSGGNTPEHFWNFGDGSPADTSRNPTHTYTAIGNFSVMYVAIDSSSCNISDTAYLSVQILQSETFSCNFIIPPYDPCVSGSYSIDLAFTGSGADSLHWDMGNGITFNNDTAINYTYSTSGTYIVALTAYDFTCNQVQTFTDTVIFDNTILNTVANASPNIFACDPPYDVTFVGGTTPNHHWDFGDGSAIDTSANPTHTYTAIGNFTVTYVEIDSSTCNITDTAYLSVQIMQSEVFSGTFTIPPYDPCSSTTYAIDLAFTGSGADSLHWDMGNGTTFTNDTAINYAYPFPGNYIVSLTAYDFTCNQVQTFTDTVWFSNSVLNAVANAAPNVLACNPPYDVTFFGAATPNHYWDFGDGSPADTSGNPTHTYTAIGNFSVMYVAIDSSTCNISDTVNLSVQILQSQTFASTFNIPPYDPCDGTFAIDLEFTGTGADSLHWDMGNGTVFINDTVIHYVYPAPGTYIITLTAYDFTCNQMQTLIDTVRFSNTSLTAVANAAPNVLACDPPYNVTFSGAATPNHYWNFGDGSLPDTSGNPIHTYTATGNFSVTYVAIDSSTCNISDTTYLTVQILQSEVFSATLAVAPYNPCVSSNFSVSLEFTGSGADSLHWNMGNGTVFNNDTIVNYTYPTQGTYTITMIAFDYTCNKIDTITQTVMFNSTIVNAVANAAPNIITCDPPYNVHFTGGGTTPEYLWNFGDGTSNSTLANPSHVFTGTGNYTVTYVAIDSNSCNIADTAYLSVQILQKEVFDAEFTTVPPQPCADSVLVDISFTGTGADSLHWDMGNGVTFINNSSIHYYYTDPGSYILTLTAYDSTCNQTETITQTIVVDKSTLNGIVTIPNVFSPDGDSKNEEFKVFFSNYPDVAVSGYFEEYNMQIFNRWGTKIFESDISGWDGTIDGKTADEGVYYYIISYKQICSDAGKITKNGHLSIFR